VSRRGVRTVIAFESAKLRAQFKARAVLALCGVGPFAFVAAVQLQSTVPADTLFGRHMKESGFAAPLVVLGFAALWAFPVLTAVVAGDLFSSEDRYGTWPTVLTRSRSRTELFAGKVVSALAFSILAVAALGASSLLAGVLLVGRQPLVDLSGVLLSSPQAFGRVVLAWLSVLPPAFGFTALAVLVSVATRSSAAGIGLPVVAGLVMQLCAYVDGPEAVRRLLLGSGFAAWHGLLTEHPYYRPVIDGTIVSGAYAAVCLTIAYRVLIHRDIDR
jgi:ABC-2 type transport system permease protein